jgi:hypothetical protein
VPALVDRHVHAVAGFDHGACFEYFKINIHTWGNVSDVQRPCQEIK